MDPERIPDYLKMIGKTIENKIDSAMNDRDEKNKKNGDAQPRPANTGQIRMNQNGFPEFEPDWDELDKKADRIVAGYAVVSAAGNVLPLPFDVMAVTMTFAKMTTELSGVYQVNVSVKRSRQIGWAIATTTGSVIGLTYVGSSLMKFIPVAGWIASLAVQAPVIGAICWAAGDALKQYFKACRQGVEPDLNSFRDSFARTLRINLATVKAEAEKATGFRSSKSTKEAEVVAPVDVAEATSAAPTSLDDALEKIATLHELQRVGAITKDEYERKKTELLKRI